MMHWGTHTHTHVHTHTHTSHSNKTNSAHTMPCALTHQCPPCSPLLRILAPGRGSIGNKCRTHSALLLPTVSHCEKKENEHFCEVPRVIHSSRCQINTGRVWVRKNNQAETIKNKFKKRKVLSTLFTFNHTGQAEERRRPTIL